MARTTRRVATKQIQIVVRVDILGVRHTVQQTQMRFPYGYNPYGNLSMIVHRSM